MLDVFITIDTEVYPLFPDWKKDNLERDIDRDIYARTADGEYGLKYQIDVMNRYGIKAVFFIEGLFASAVGLDPLRNMVRLIIDNGHEVQLHLHPEWLEWIPDSPIQYAGRWAVNQFSYLEQTQLISMGKSNLNNAGATSVIAFRAGDYAANSDTLLALAKNGISYDTSCNPCYERSFPDIPESRSITQPKIWSDIEELPISYWETRPVGRRHAQLTSSSMAEFRNSLWHAYRNQWKSFVIVSHSFEMLKRRRQRISAPSKDQVVISRFVELCQFLQRHSDKFRTCGFGDYASDRMGNGQGDKAVYRSSLFHTACRVIQQGYRRLT